MTFDNETIKELTSVLPEQFRELRPEGKAWTVSKAAYIREIRQMMVFHLDCKKLILRVWILRDSKFVTAKKAVLRKMALSSFVVALTIFL